MDHYTAGVAIVTNYDGRFPSAELHSWVVRRMTNLPLIISCVSIVIAILTFYRTAPSQQLRRDQIAQMRILASRVATFWIQLESAMTLVRSESAVDPYMRQAMVYNAGQLRDAIEKCIGLGLLSDFLDKEAGELYRLTAFLQSLGWLAGLSDKEQQTIPFDDFLKAHIVMGVIRTLKLVVEHDPTLVTPNVARAFRPAIDNGYTQAVNYLSPQPGTQPNTAVNPNGGSGALTD